MQRDYKYIGNPDGTATIIRTCMCCGKPAIFTAPGELIFAWEHGGSAQDVFPDRSADDREILITGTHGACFDALGVDVEAAGDEPDPEATR